MFEQLLRHPGTFVVSIVLALIPVVAWGYFFYRKKAIPKRTAVVTFFAGTFAIIPVLLYQFSWSYIPDISIHYYIPQLIHSPGWYTVGFFVIASEIIAFLAAITSALSVMLVALLTWTKGVFTNVIRAVMEEDTNFKIVGLCIAVFAILVVYSGYSAAEALIITVSFAALEEFVKHLVVRFVDDNRITCIDDAMEYSILVGLGFAFTENIFYFFLAWRTGTFAQVFIVRSILSVFAHVFFSGIFGYYYGIAHFATAIYYEEVHQNRHVLIRLLHKFLHMRGSVLFHEEKMMEGLMIVVILHGIFNHLMRLDQLVLIVPFLFVGFFVLSYLFDRKEDQKEFQYVSTERTTGKFRAVK